MTTKLISGDEVDAIEHKELFGGRPGVRKNIKRGISRRDRRQTRNHLRQGRYGN